MTQAAPHAGFSEVHSAVLALGSNLGDRELAIRRAVRGIAALDGVVLVAASGLVETAAVTADGIDQDAPAYLNAVVVVHTTLSPRGLLAAVNAIEVDLGRVRETRWGDRTIDIDIISIGGLQLDSPELVVPHPRAAERPFVVAPWLQVDPDAVLVGRGRIADLMGSLEPPAGYPAEPLL